MNEPARLLIGWREWISLPKLKLPAIKAKVDTGAKTSALHAYAIEPYLERGAPHVRFLVHPLRGRKDIIVECHAAVIDHRFVSDSGGHREKRYVIETQILIGGLLYPIELTLANRETMTHRMLIGRSAMKPLMIDPAHDFLLGRPERIARAYKAIHKSSHGSKAGAAKSRGKSQLRKSTGRLA